ncbi:mucin-2 [Musca domestica]|uniref:Sporozoite P67 surface antigen n=1 Tax=Musca domestica TaxID=7370 RepID=T1PBE1_MUSDO|nr:mucin-2 [Musca domestica]
MLTGISYLLVTCLATISTAIRVDWNTNTGPIIPPTPRTTIRPIPPFREPAPVWEDLSNDIPNPNPYVYVLPPPSRPKQRLNTNVNYDTNPNKYGTLIRPSLQTTNYYQQQSNTPQQVAGLAPQYIPNVGTRYVAVVPKTSGVTGTTSSTAANVLSPNDNENNYKFQGKYNAKTKKYKVYEKVKYVPINYYTELEENDSVSEATSKRNLPAEIPVWAPFDDEDLPNVEYTVKLENLLATAEKLSGTTPVTTTSTTNTSMASSTPSTSAAPSSSSTPAPSKSSFKFYSKHIYPKDSTLKLKEKLNKKS